MRSSSRPALPMNLCGADPDRELLPRAGAMKRTERERLRRPRPRDVGGFSHAASQGLLPSVPSMPPTFERGVLLPSARGILRTGMARFFSVTGIYVLVVFGGLPRWTLPSGVVVLTLLTLGTGWFVLMLRTLERPGQRALDEILHGYCTLDSNGPNYSRSSEHSWGEGGPPWDYSGVWLLDRKFAVRSCPNLQIDPPGFYPSPHRAGQWELWTGVLWSGIYRTHPWPRTRLHHPTAAVRP